MTFIKYYCHTKKHNSIRPRFHVHGSRFHVHGSLGVTFTVEPAVNSEDAASAVEDEGGEGGEDAADEGGESSGEGGADEVEGGESSEKHSDSE